MSEKRDESLSARDRIRSDRRAGALLSLRDYSEMFPGEDAAIARAYTEVGGEATMGPASDRPRESGDHLGPFRLVRELGRGGQGIVYLAEDTRLRRRVALKALSSAGPDAERNLQRFWREAEVASKLDHPGICGVIEAGTDGGTAYIAMRYVEGESLAARISRTRDRTNRSGTPESGSQETLDIEFEDFGADGDGSAAQPTRSRPRQSASAGSSREEIREVLEIFERCARALHAAHEAGIVHRDIKPANVMIGRDGHPVILDFGLARDDSDDAGPTLTETGDLFGTPAYMSPEQLTGQRVRLDGRTDVYSLGVSLFECLALRRPFEAPTREALYQAVLTKEAPRLRRLNRAVPADLEVVLETALEKDRERRYATALAFAEDLAAVRENRPIRARPVGPAGRALRFAKRRPVTASLLLTLMLGLPLVAGLFGYIYAHRDDIEAQNRARLEAEVEALVADGFYELHHVGAPQALESFERARELLPSSPEAAGGLAMTLLELKRPESALSALEAITPLPPALLRVKARVLRALDRDAAAKALEAGPGTEATTHFGHFFEAQESMREGHEAGPESGSAVAYFEAARDHFERAIALSDRPRLAYFLGYAHVVSHIPSTSESPPLVEALLSLWPDNPWSWYWAGLAETKNPKLALSRLERARELDPKIPTDARRALLLVTTGRSEEGLAVAQELRARGPDDVGVLVALTRVDLALQRWPEAEASARRILASEPDSYRGYALLAQALLGLGRHSEALEAAEEAKRRLPGDPLALFLEAEALALCGRLEEAEAVNRLFLSLNPEDAAGRMRLGTTLAMQGRFAEAREFFEELALADEDSVVVWVNLSATRLGTGDFGGAFEAARRAVEIEPRQIECHVNLGTSLVLAGRIEEARPVAQEAYDIAPRRPEVLELMASLAKAEGRGKDEIEFLERAVEASPEPVRIARLGSALLDQGEMARAEEVLRRAADLGQPQAAYMIGAMLANQGRGAQAIAEYRRAIELDPNHAEAHCNLGLLLGSRGDRESGIPLLRRGHELGTARGDWKNPSSTWLAAELAMHAFSLRASDPVRAVALGREALGYEPDHTGAQLCLGSILGADETPEELRDPREALYLAQKAVAKTGREPFPLSILAQALAANGFSASALDLAEQILASMNGSDAGPYKLAFAEELLANLRAKAAAGASD